MSVVAHAEHDEIGRQGQMGDARVGRGEFLVRRQAHVGKRREARRRRAIAQQRLAHQSRIRSRAIVGDAPFVGERDGHAGPVELRFDSAAKKRAGDVPPETTSSAAPRAAMAARKRSAVHSAKAVRRAPRRWRIRGVEIGCYHSYSSFQVRPSRSISATDALGPQVPAA